jgi:hypothetical protein
MGAEVDNAESEIFLYVLNLKNSLFVLIFFLSIARKSGQFDKQSWGKTGIHLKSR